MYKKDSVSYGMADLKRDNPNVSFPRNALENPTIRAEYGVEEVPPDERKPFDIKPVTPDERQGYRVTASEPEFVDGQWRQGWMYIEITFDEVIAELRLKRNSLLDASDWTQVADVALTVEEDTSWRDYRKELRDLPAGLRTADDVAGVAWPTV